MKPLLLHVLLSVILLSKVATGGVLTGPEDEDYPNDDDEDLDDDDDFNSGVVNERANIISQPLDLKVKAGTNVSLPCSVDDPDADIVEWHHGKTRIFMDNVSMINNSRLSTSDGFLHISYITTSDAGVYNCSLVTSGERLTHIVHVKSPAIIISFNITRDNPESLHRHLVWMKGSRQNISCVAGGYPVPEVTISHLWLHGKHKSSEPKILNGNPYIIDPVERRHAGKYSCEAKNDQFTTNKGIQVDVEYAPEINVSKEYVSTSIGVETTLMCRVAAHPAATVSWTKDNEQVVFGSSMDHRVEEHAEGSHHYLVIKGTERSDFAQYTCTAANVHGTSFKSIHVSGEPSKPTIDSITSDEKSGPVVTWKIQSLSRVDKFRVQYRKQQDNVWEEMDIRDSSHLSGDTYLAKHKFDHLDEGTYRIRGMAQNSYGWSQTSDEELLPGNKHQSKPWVDNSYSQLESVKAGAPEMEHMRISVVLLLSILAAHFLR